MSMPRPRSNADASMRTLAFSSSSLRRSSAAFLRSMVISFRLHETQTTSAGCPRTEIGGEAGVGAAGKAEPRAPLDLCELLVLELCLEFLDRLLLLDLLHPILPLLGLYALREV